MSNYRIDYYTDGACSQNPGPGGWAVIKLTDYNGANAPKVCAGLETSTTNNAMELRAFQRALKDISFLAAQHSYDIHIHTDSAYIHNCFDQKWYKYWESHNWQTKTNGPVKNREVWEDILYMYRNWINLPEITLTLHKVIGHSTNEYNNLADKYAVAARKGKYTTDDMFVPIEI